LQQNPACLEGATMTRQKALSGLMDKSLCTLSRQWRIVIILALIFNMSGCTAKTDAQGIDKPNPQLPTITISSGSIDLVVEVADSEIERNRGLMFRKSLADGKGMLFVFEYDQKMAFWMKNTSIPLSIAYLGSDGTIYQILDLVPFSQEARTSERSIRYALEVPKGWFDRVGIKVGDRFDIKLSK
jgi:hypothetical protein